MRPLSLPSLRFGCPSPAEGRGTESSPLPSAGEGDSALAEGGEGLLTDYPRAVICAERDEGEFPARHKRLGVPVALASNYLDRDAH